MFDIEEYNWKDSRVFVLDSDKEYIRLNSDEYMGEIYREDAIAIAEHFNIIKDKTDGKS
jgi:hypothetical protein